MRETVKATWDILEQTCKNAKLKDSNIYFDEDAFDICYSHFKRWREILLEGFMKKEVVELDRHKIAAILTISIIESKAVSYEGDLKDKIFIGSQLFAVTSGLTYMQDQLNEILEANGYNSISKYVMPAPFSCDTDYLHVIARNLYYEEYGCDLSGEKLWHLNPLQLANTYYFLELYTIEHKDIPCDILKE